MKIPLDIHEAGVMKHHARDSRTGELVPDAVIDTLAQSARHARESAEALKAFHDAVLADSGRSADARFLDLRDQALKVAEAQARRLDSAREKARAEVTSIAEAIHAPPAIDPVLATEIRTTLKAMTTEQRQEVIQKATRERDDATLAAILRAPGYLSGVGEGSMIGCREGWQRQRFPAEHDRLLRLKQAADAQERVARSFLKMIRELTTGTAAQLAEASEAAKAASVAIHKHMEAA